MDGHGLLLLSTNRVMASSAMAGVASVEAPEPNMGGLASLLAQRQRERANERKHAHAKSEEAGGLWTKSLRYASSVGKPLHRARQSVGQASRYGPSEKARKLAIVPASPIGTAIESIPQYRPQCAIIEQQ